MKLLRHWKMILGLLAIFVAGMGTGGFVTVVGIIKIVKHNSEPEVWVNARMAELQRKLKLTPEQGDKIRPLLKSAVEKVQGIVKTGFTEILGVVDDTHTKVAAELTPEQKEKFVQMREGAMKRWREFMQQEIAKAPPKPF